MIAHHHNRHVGAVGHGRGLRRVGAIVEQHLHSRPCPFANPSSVLTKYGGVPLYQSSSTCPPRGITAMDLSFVDQRQSVALFFKSTIDSSVARRANALLDS